VTPYSEEGAVGYPMAYRTLALIQNRPASLAAITLRQKGIVNVTAASA
jgi:hypothetical protein